MRLWFWRLYWLASVLVIGGMLFGARLELALAPVRVEQSIQAVERQGDRLCWVWASTKARPLVSDDMDVKIDTPTEHGASSSIYERDTGMPWTASRAVAAGRRHWQPYCVVLPPYVTPATPVRVRQTAWYPGLWRLWRLPVHLPDVVDPKAADLPP